MGGTITASEENGGTDQDTGRLEKMGGVLFARRRFGVDDWSSVG